LWLACDLSGAYDRVVPRQRPTFAAPDRLKRLVQSVLSDNLIQPKYRVDWNARDARRMPRFEGHCYSATEAYWHLKGGLESGLLIKQLTMDDRSSHRWLETADGSIIDLTIADGEERKMRSYPYDDGRDMPFIKPRGRAISARAQEIVDRVERAKALR
jgi:hypothetical protein